MVHCVYMSSDSLFVVAFRLLSIQVYNLSLGLQDMYQQFYFYFRCCFISNYCCTYMRVDDNDVM